MNIYLGDHVFITVHPCFILEFQDFSLLGCDAVEHDRCAPVLKETCYFWGIRLFTMKQVPRKHWYTPAKICEITFQKI